MKFTESAVDGGQQEEESDAVDRDITFLYEVGEGVAHRSYGLNVAKLAGLPRSLLEEASRRSSQMEVAESKRRLAYLSKAAALLIEDGRVDALEHLIAGVEQL